MLITTFQNMKILCNMHPDTQLMDYSVVNILRFTQSYKLNFVIILLQYKFDLHDQRETSKHCYVKQ